MIGLKTGDVLDLNQFDLGIHKITQFYQNKGFLYFKIINKDRIVDLQKSLQSANLLIQIDEGPLANVNQIRVKGNKDIQSQFIIHASGIKVGEANDS